MLYSCQCICVPYPVIDVNALLAAPIPAEMNMNPELMHIAQDHMFAANIDENCEEDNNSNNNRNINNNNRNNNNINAPPRRNVPERAGDNSSSNQKDEVPHIRKRSILLVLCRACWARGYECSFIFCIIQPRKRAHRRYCCAIYEIKFIKQASTPICLGTQSSDCCICVSIIVYVKSVIYLMKRRDLPLTLQPRRVTNQAIRVSNNNTSTRALNVMIFIVAALLFALLVRKWAVWAH